MFNASDARKNAITYVETLRAEKKADATAWVENTALEVIKKESANGNTACRVPCGDFCGERLMMAEQMLTELGFGVSYNGEYHRLYITW